MKKAVALLLALIMVFALCGCNKDDYETAMSLISAEKYEDAIIILKDLGDYKDSIEQLKKCNEEIENRNVLYCNTLLASIQDQIANNGTFSTFDYDEAKGIYGALSDTAKQKIIDANVLEDNAVRYQVLKNEHSIQSGVLRYAEEKIKNNLRAPSTYKCNYDYASVDVGINDPTIVSGYGRIEYSAENSFGGTVDNKIMFEWSGTYKNEKLEIVEFYFTK